MSRLPALNAVVRAATAQTLQVAARRVDQNRNGRIDEVERKALEVDIVSRGVLDQSSTTRLKQRDRIAVAIAHTVLHHRRGQSMSLVALRAALQKKLTMVISRAAGGNSTARELARLMVPNVGLDYIEQRLRRR